MTQIQIIGLIMYKTNMRVDKWAKNKDLAVATVYRVVAGKTVKGASTEKVRQAISADVGKDLVEIWPEAANTQ